MGMFVNTVDMIGDDELVNRLIEKSAELEEFLDDKVAFVGRHALAYFPALKKVIFKTATGMDRSAFIYSESLRVVDLYSISEISGYAFNYCSSLIALVLRNSAVCTRDTSVSNFVSTPIASGTGYIYVPAALVDSYKADANWSEYASQIRALEEYTVDGTTTGELDETKI